MNLNPIPDKYEEENSMKDLIKTKQFLMSLFLLFLGILSIAMENIFYGDIDKNGVLQESFFLPLGMFSFLLGVLGLMTSTFWFYLKRLKKPTS